MRQISESIMDLIKELIVVKPEWGTKRTCPKCSTRFYDLGNEDPITCIDCGTAFKVEPILKEKQSHVIETKAMAKEDDKSETEDPELKDILLDDDDDVEVEEDDTVLGDVSLDDEDEDVTKVIDAGVVTQEES